MAKRKETKRQTIMYKTLHRKLKIEQHKRNKKHGMNSDAVDGYVVPAPLVAHVMSDCCLMPNEQLFSYIMVRSYIRIGDDIWFVLGQHA